MNTPQAQSIVDLTDALFALGTTSGAKFDPEYALTCLCAGSLLSHIKLLKQQNKVGQFHPEHSEGADLAVILSLFGHKDPLTTRGVRALAHAASLHPPFTDLLLLVHRELMRRGMGLNAFWHATIKPMDDRGFRHMAHSQRPIIAVECTRKTAGRQVLSDIKSAVRAMGSRPGMVVGVAACPSTVQALACACQLTLGMFQARPQNMQVVVSIAGCARVFYVLEARNPSSASEEAA